MEGGPRRSAPRPPHTMRSRTQGRGRVCHQQGPFTVPWEEQNLGEKIKSNLVSCRLSLVGWLPGNRRKVASRPALHTRATGAKWRYTEGPPPATQFKMAGGPPAETLRLRCDGGAGHEQHLRLRPPTPDPSLFPATGSMQSRAARRLTREQVLYWRERRWAGGPLLRKDSEGWVTV